MRIWKRLLLLLGAATCWGAALFIVLHSGLPERATYTGYIESGQRVAPELNAFAPPFSLTTLGDVTVHLGDLRGRAVIVNFWATWCEPCKVEMPDLQALYQQYQSQGLRLLAVNLGEPSSVAQQWVNEFDLTFDILLDQTQSVAAVYQLRGQPSTYVISPDGIIAYIVYGPTTREALEAAIAPFFPNV
ncbi:MAG: TlpA disulfide reductase family protein [Anaerolineae bacterium]